MKKMFHVTSSSKKLENTMVFWENVWGIIGLITFIGFVALVISLFGDLNSFARMWVK